MESIKNPIINIKSTVYSGVTLEVVNQKKTIGSDLGGRNIIVF